MIKDSLQTDAQMTIDLTEKINQTEDIYIILVEEALLLSDKRYIEIFVFFKLIKLLLNKI